MQRRRTTIRALWLIVSIFTTWTPTFYQQPGVVALGAASRQANGLEEIARGRRAVAQTCVPCHSGISRIIQLHKKSTDEWRNTVYSMIGRGAHILPEEIEPIAAFLAATAGVAGPSPSAPARPADGQTGAAVPPSLPLAAEARVILERHCLQCHDLELATRRPASADWNAVITRMVSYGADISSTEQQTLVEFLNAPPAQP